MMSDYDSILTATDSNIINRSEFYSTGKGMPDHDVAMIGRPYTISGDDNIMYCLILMFIVIAYAFYRSRLLMVYRIKTYFTTKRVFSDENVNENNTESFVVFLLTCIGALSLSICMFHTMSLHFSFPDYYSLPYWILGVSGLSALLYLYLRAFIYMLVNWVFFDDESRNRWNNGFFLTAVLLSFAFYVLAVVTVFSHLSIKSVTLCTLFIYILYEILLLYKLLVNFKIKKYGAVMIFLYFCSVELLPMMLIWRLLQWVFSSYIVNNLFT